MKYADMTTKLIEFDSGVVADQKEKALQNILDDIDVDADIQSFSDHLVVKCGYDKYGHLTSALFIYMDENGDDDD